MTFTIPVTSTKRHRAERFARELERVMRHRDVGTRPVAEALGASRTTIMYWRTGRVLPRLATAARLAQVLDAPRLLELAGELRRKRCPVDDVEFVDDTGSDNRIYCSTSCLRVGQKAKAGRPVRETAVRAERALARHRAAVAAMCAGCEPEGACRDAECALRPVSPLPLLELRREPVVVTSKRGGWTDPDRRSRESSRQARVWAQMTPEERAARVSRAAAASRRARGLEPAGAA